MHKLKIILSVVSVVLLLIVALVYLQQTTKLSMVEDIPIVEYGTEPVPDFSLHTVVKDKKKAFFDYLSPAVKAQNEYIRNIRQYVQGLRAKHLAGEDFSQEQQAQFDWLIHEYRVGKDLPIEEVFIQLFRKIDIIPIELVLVQTANESGWGTSRFATKGYNFFGLWCFSKGCGFVPSRRNDGAAHEVAKFDDLSSAMYAYMRNLNSHPAYKDMRLIRQKYRSNQKPITAYSMAEGLTKYSERGEEYVDELRDMMRINKELITP
jgi:Bax protein